jgi:hypothetical protein
MAATCGDKNGMVASTTASATDRTGSFSRAVVRPYLRPVTVRSASCTADGISSSLTTLSPAFGGICKEYSRQDSNLQPLAPEANALSN